MNNQEINDKFLIMAVVYILNDWWTCPIWEYNPEVDVLKMLENAINFAFNVHGNKGKYWLYRDIDTRDLNLLKAALETGDVHHVANVIRENHMGGIDSKWEYIQPPPIEYSNSPSKSSSLRPAFIIAGGICLLAISVGVASMVIRSRKT